MAIHWLSIALATLVYYFVTRRERPKHLNLPPGPKKLPVIGNLHQLGVLPHRSLWNLARVHGPVMSLRLGSVSAVVVSSAEAATEMMKTRDLDFCSRPRSVATEKLFYHNTGLTFTPYGEYWRAMRKICIHELFSTKRVEAFHFVRKEEKDLMIQSIASSTLEPINVSQVMVNYANNIICRASYGRRYQDGEGEDHHEARQILIESQSLAISFFVADYFPWLGWMDRLTGMAGRLRDVASKLDSFMEQVIREHLDKKIRPEQEDIVDILLQLKDENATLTNDNIKAILNDLFIAGTDTISATTIWAMTELARSPRLMNKVQEEIRSVVGAKGAVEETDLHKLQLLRAVIKETLRLHPPAPLLVPRESIWQSKLGGYDILPNTLIYTSVWGIGRDHNSWEKPEEFIPERFIDSSIDFQGHDFRLIPFGSGRRICPAMNFGMVAVEFALANLLYSFSWKLPAGVQPVDINLDEAPGVTVHKKYSLYLVATKSEFNN